jgi:hypothetical protein
MIVCVGARQSEQPRAEPRCQSNNATLRSCTCSLRIIPFSFDSLAVCQARGVKFARCPTDLSVGAAANVALSVTTPPGLCTLFPRPLSSLIATTNVLTELALSSHDSPG